MGLGLVLRVRVSGSGFGLGLGGQGLRQAGALVRPSRARRSALLSTGATARRPYRLPPAPSGRTV